MAMLSKIHNYKDKVKLIWQYFGKKCCDKFSMIIPVKTVYFSGRFSFSCKKILFFNSLFSMGKKPQNLIKDLSMGHFFSSEPSVLIIFFDALGNDCARKLCSILGCPISYLHPSHCKSLLLLQHNVKNTTTDRIRIPEFHHHLQSAEALKIKINK